MHGLINKALQSFVTDTYGVEAWAEIADEAALGMTSFEPMLTHDASFTDEAVDAAVAVLGKPRDAFLEDLGIYLVAHPNSETLRRLLRFGGDTFQEFVSSLDDLPDRVRLAVPTLDFPTLEVFEKDGAALDIEMSSKHDGATHVLAGVLQGMADDYGALVTIDCQSQGTSGHVSVRIHDAAFAEGRSFELAMRSGA